MGNVVFSGRELKQTKRTGRHRKPVSSWRMWQMAAASLGATIVLAFAVTTALLAVVASPAGSKSQDSSSMQAFQTTVVTDSEQAAAEDEAAAASERLWIENIRELSKQQQEEVAAMQRQKEEALKLAQAQQAARAKPITPLSVNTLLVGDQSQARAIDIYLTEQGSPMVNYGRAFVSAGRAFGVDPFLVVAISGKESSWGKDCFLPYNAWGWGDVSYASVEDAIFNYTRCFGEEYIHKGRTTPEVISPIYCPPNNGSWTRDVTLFYNEVVAIHNSLQR